MMLWTQEAQTMQRVDSQTTLNQLIDALADTALTDEARTAQVKGHLDAFIDAPSPAGKVEQSTRLFNRGLALPAAWGAMRACVNQVLCEDACARVPDMALTAQVAQAVDMAGLLYDALRQYFEPLHRWLPEPNKSALAQGLRESMDALSINDMMTWFFARGIPLSVLQAAHEAGVGESSVILDAVAACAPSIVSDALAGRLKPARPDEAADLARARAFLQACGHKSLQAVEMDAATRDLVATALERATVRASTPAALERLTAFFEAPNGKAFVEKVEAAAPALFEMTRDQLVARLPWMQMLVSSPLA